MVLIKYIKLFQITSFYSIYVFPLLWPLHLQIFTRQTWQHFSRMRARIMKPMAGIWCTGEKVALLSHLKQ